MEQDKIIFYKKIIMQLEKGPSARHIVFYIQLKERANSAQDWETLQTIAHPLTLSIWGAESLQRCACQRLDHIKQYAARVKPQDKNIFDFICDIWERYHLNDMKAGTKQQENELYKMDRTLLYASNYYDACEQLKKINLYKDRGIEWGRGWLVEQIPSEIISQIMKL